jgi:DNA-binding MarR family transcriptional regulator
VPSTSTPADDDVARVARIASSVVRRIRTQGGSASELSITQDWALALLANLARVQNVRAQTMSTAIAGLEKLGYVAKRADPRDGRRLILQATDEGVAARDRAHTAKQQWLEATLTALDESERRDLRRGLDLLERIAETPGA